MKILNKYLLLAMVMVGSTLQLNAQSEQLLSLLNKIEDGDGVTSVLVTKKMFELFSKTANVEVEGESLNDVIGGLQELKVFEIDKNKASKIPSLNFNAMSDILKKGGYEVLLKIKDDGENVEIYILEDNGMVKHLFLIAQDESDLQLISLLGNIDLEKISKLSGTLNVEELKHLDKKKK
ncbi:MAG: DUF4252 domain-containing protein [Bacteroidetes bacterium]|nr:DUF4252 domain-containing protein [Bacteroidota bacterium]